MSNSERVENSIEFPPLTPAQPPTPTGIPPAPVKAETSGTATVAPSGGSAVASEHVPSWAQALVDRVDSLSFELQRFQRAQAAAGGDGVDPYPPHLRESNPFPARLIRTGLKPQLLNLHGDEVHNENKTGTQAGVMQQMRALSKQMHGRVVF